MMKKIKTTYDNRSVEVWAEKIKGQVWFHFSGESYCYTPESSRKSHSAAQSSEPGVIKAPMPGKIIKIMAKAGDKVSKGQVLIAMEAMKMEYSLEADIDGEIAQLNVDDQQQVELGQVLVKIEADSES